MATPPTTPTRHRTRTSNPASSPADSAQPTSAAALGSDRAIAARFLAEIRAKHQFLLDSAERLHVFEGGRMVECPPLWVQNWMARATSQPLSNNLIQLVHQNLKSLQGRLAEHPPLGLVNCLDGVIDPRNPTRPPRPADPSLWPSTVQIPVRWNPEAKCPKTIDFLNAVLPPGALEFVWELLGSYMVPDVFTQQLVWLPGAGGNGKGTFIKWVAGILGSENAKPVILGHLAINRFAVADAYQRLLLFDADVQLAEIRDVTILKQLTAHDSVRGERKNQPSFDFKFYGNLLLAANDTPSTKELSRGWLDRPLMMWFNNRIRHTAQDRMDQEAFVAELLEEAPGVLNLAIEGLGRLMARRMYLLPDSIVDATANYRREADPFNRFADNHLEATEGGWVHEGTLREFHIEWCRSEGIKHLSNIEIRKWIGRRWPKEVFYSQQNRSTKTGPRGYHGLNLRSTDI